MSKATFNIERGKSSGGWTNFKVYPVRKARPKTMVIKTKSGSMLTVSSKKMVYHLAFNGERFAHGKELASFKKDFPLAYSSVLEAVSRGDV